MEIRGKMPGEATSTSYVLFFVRLISTILLVSVHCQDTFNVLDYGAVGNGETDDSSAFDKAWKEACSSTKGPTMVIPQGKTYLVNPITFSGPCKSQNINIDLLGTIVSPKSRSAWEGKDQSRWMEFRSVNGLNINGSGKVNGLGEQWWSISCRRDPKSGCNKLAPTAISFDRCNGVSMSQIAIQDSPQTHLLLYGCTNVTLEKIEIRAPDESPNTDGIHIQASSGVKIHDSVIGSGDDCISIGDETWDINITDITCGPGHGVSIGSLGRDGGAVDVHDIYVSRVNFTETTNGARIKTWQVGRGNVKKVYFSHLNFTNVKYPIIIDQYYCEVAGHCANTTGGVRVSDVHYTNVAGTSKTDVAVMLACNKDPPCTDIVLDTVDIGSAKAGHAVVSQCENAFGKTSGTVRPSSCLK